jgi:hypothetical protein
MARLSRIWPFPWPRPRPAPIPHPLPWDPIGHLLALHNDLRLRRRLGPLSLIPLLVQSAKFESDDMAAHGRLDHTSSDGRSPFRRMQDVGYRYVWAGENIGMGYPTPEAAFAGWEGSAAHLANILNPRFIDVGFAVSVAAGVPYWTADFGSTMMGLATATGLPGPYETYYGRTCAVAYRPV